MLQVLPSDRVSISELWNDDWTIAVEPMPGATSDVVVECSHQEGGVQEGKMSAAWRLARCAVPYVVYSALLVGMVLAHERQEKEGR